MVKLLRISSNGLLRRNLRSYSTETGRQRLLILGTGWSSYALLKTIDKEKYDVIVVSPRNHFLFTPLLASTTVGTLEFRSIIEPIRNTVFRQSDHFHLSHAIALDPQSRTLECQSLLKQDHKYSLTYDKLVIGVGALSNTFGVPGVEEHAFYLKEVADARAIRNRLLSNIELALQPGFDVKERQRLLHVVIVGGGPTGVEFGAELYDFVEQDVARLYKDNAKDIRVTLVESNHILASFDDRLRSFAEKKIEKRDRMSLVQSSVTDVREDGVTLANGTDVPCGLVVWSTGLAPRQFTSKIDLPRNNRGQVLTDRYMRVKDHADGSLFAIGDCADIEDYALPCTAQVAEREGRYLANLLSSDTPLEKAKPFAFKGMGMMAYIGEYEALSDLPQAKLRGFPSWLLWRSAYLTRLGSWRLRLQVPMDWLKTLIYGRDISRF